MLYRYMLAKHLDHCQKEVLGVYDTLNSFLLNIDGIESQSGMTCDVFTITIPSITELLKTSSELIGLLQSAAYGSPTKEELDRLGIRTVPTTGGGILYSKKNPNGSGNVLTTEPPELDFQETDEHQNVEEP